MVCVFRSRQHMGSYRALVGKEFIYGQQDCFSLVRQFYALRGIDLPDYERPLDLHTSDSIFLDQAVAYGFKSVPFEARQLGDVFIMRLGTRTPMHAAIYIPDDKILHQRHGSLSALEVFGRYYRSRVAAVYRYATGDACG